MRRCLYITWCTNGFGTFGIGVFEDEFGKKEIRASVVNSHNEKADIQCVDDWGGRIDPEQLMEILRTFTNGEKMKTKLLKDKEIISALKSGIEYYSGKHAKEIFVVEDPKVEGTYAIRCELSGIKVDFLIISFNRSMTKEEIAENLEECEFESFPPESKSLKFFL